MATEARPSVQVFDQLEVRVYPDMPSLGRAAAADLAAILAEGIAQRGVASVILATGNSQLPFMDALRARSDVDWRRVVVFHMDEYLGMPEDHPASFRRFIRTHLTDLVHPRTFFGICGDTADVQRECARYTALLQEYPPDATVLGIGENGHLAFNDPPADFEANDAIRVVELDEACRRQQVGEGHFGRLDDVPRQAFSLTIPALLRARRVQAVVPEARKAAAVQAALERPIEPGCPASILRRQSHARLYLDGESSAQVQRLRG